MTTQHVYHMQFWTTSEDRPWIDFELSENSQNISWIEIGKISEGTTSVATYSPIHLVVNDVDATAWHSYSIAGTYGLLSRTAVDLIRPHMQTWFEFLEAFVNNSPYYLLRRIATLDCLDRSNSELIPFPSDPDSIMSIQKYRFIKDQIPKFCAFPIPEINWHLFAADGVIEIVGGLGLKGIYFIDAEMQ